MRKLGEPEKRCWRVTGVVQGVGFRAFVQREAIKLGLTGYARNMADGSVEVVAEGPGPKLASLARALKIGPRGSVVRAVEERPLAAGVEIPVGFEIR